ncbi:hypothetical protein GOV10_02320 [Candidatus Woesearchaeota archaeon]|nr:hypothetical protein [Candidatus Woesearchaeota archaeon]
MIDANIVFAILLTKGKTDEIFFESPWSFFAPPLLLEEIERYVRYLLKKSKRVEEEFWEIKERVLQKVCILPANESFLLTAADFSPDIDDIEFLALALQLNCPLWSNDKKLKEQDVVPVFSTEDLCGTSVRRD